MRAPRYLESVDNLRCLAAAILEVAVRDILTSPRVEEGEGSCAFEAFAFLQGEAGRLVIEVAELEPEQVEAMCLSSLIQRSRELLPKAVARVGDNSSRVRRG